MATIINNSYLFGVDLSSGDFLDNGTEGEIGSNGVVGAGAGVTVVNYGGIFGLGVGLTDGGYVRNAREIEGSFGVTTGSGLGTVVNYGTIYGGYHGVYLGGGGTVINEGIITGVTDGVRAAGYGSSYTTISNAAGATIEGNTGVYVNGPSATVVNYGTIDGTGGTAVDFVTPGSTLVVEAGSTLVGVAAGGGGTLALDAAAGPGTLSGLGTQYSGFSQYVVDAGASWTLTGANAIASSATLVDNGTLTVDASLTGAGKVVDAGTLIDNGSIDTDVTVGSGGVELVNAGGSAANTTVDAGGVQTVAAGATSQNTVLGAAPPIVYDPAADFAQGWTTQSNANGVWSYGYSNGAFGPVTLFDTAGLVDNVAEDWQSSAVSVTTSNGAAPSLADIDGNEVIEGQAINLELLPGSGYSTDLVFTAPADGAYAIEGDFVAIEGSIGAGISVGGNFVFFAFPFGGGGPFYDFDINTTLTAGETVEFSASPAFGAQIVGLTATITALPATGGGVENVYGSATGTQINPGAVETVYACGVDTSATIAGTQAVHGTANGATVLSGGNQQVEAGGSASATTISGGGSETVYGSDTSATIGSGGTQLVGSGGAAVDATVSAGGSQTVLSAGSTTGTLIDGGGSEIVSGGGVASATTIGDGGTEAILAGGTAADLTFAGSNGTLDLAQSADVSGAISGLQVGDTIDFTNTDVTGAAINGTTLTITEMGGASYNFTLAGAEANIAPVLSSDNRYGTDLTLVSVDGWAGGNGDWSNAANWYEGTPGPTTRWEITTPGVTVTLAAGESYSAGAGTVVAGAGLDVAGTLAMSGALTVDGVVVNSGTLDPTVSVAAGGYLNNQAGAQIVGNTGAYAQNGGPGVYLAAGGTLVNAGAITGGRR